MGFSIGGLLGGLAPIIGGAFGGPIGAAVGGVVGSAFAPRPPSVAPPIPTVTRAGGEIIGPFSAIGSALGLRGNGGCPPRPKTRLQMILEEAREFQCGATRNKIIDAAKFCGIDQAADVFGLGTDDICFVVIQGKTQRRRGISAANIRTTRRVVRFNKKLSKDLKAVR